MPNIAVADSIETAAPEGRAGRAGAPGAPDATDEGAPGEDIAEALREALRELTDAARAEAGEIWLLERGSEALHLEVLYGGGPVFFERSHLRLGEGLPGLAAARRRAVFAPELAAEPAFLRRAVVDAGYRAFRAVPLRAGGATLGVLCLASVEPATLTRRRAGALREAANRLARVVAEHRAREDRRRAQARGHGSAVREAIARSLLEHLIETLFAVGLGLEVAASAPRGDERLLRSAQRDVDTAIRDARWLMAQFERDSASPSAHEGLRTRLASLLFRRATAPVWTLTVAAGDDPLDPRIDVAAYLILRELVENVYAHAHATAASLTVRRTGEVLALAVRDDGRGFDPGSVPTGTGGLHRLMRRVDALGGRVAIESTPGAGTRVRAEIPLRGSASASSPAYWLF